MTEAEAAFEIARQYAADQIAWYDRYAVLKHLLFRISGIAIIVATVLITYLAATLDKSDDMIWRFKKKNTVAILAATSAILVAVASLFDWRSAWENHRLAQLEIEAIIKIAEIEKLELIANSRDDELFELARSLTNDVRFIVSNETVKFFSTQPDVEESVSGN